MFCSRTMVSPAKNRWSGLFVSVRQLAVGKRVNSRGLPLEVPLHDGDLGALAR